MFKKDFKTATVKRLAYSTGDYKKSSYSETGGVYQGNLKALTLDDGVDLNSFGRMYEFHTCEEADIQESDKLIIDNVEYDVKGIGNFYGVTFSRKMVLLNRTENGN